MNLVMREWRRNCRCQTGYFWGVCKNGILKAQKLSTCWYKLHRVGEGRCGVEQCYVRLLVLDSNVNSSLDNNLVPDSGDLHLIT